MSRVGVQEVQVERGEVERMAAEMAAGTAKVAEAAEMAAEGCNRRLEPEVTAAVGLAEVARGMERREGVAKAAVATVSGTGCRNRAAPPAGLHRFLARCEVGSEWG